MVRQRCIIQLERHLGLIMTRMGIDLCLPSIGKDFNAGV